MPVKRRGLLSSHFEKIICGVVAIGLIAVVVVGLNRNRGHEIEVQRERIGKAIGTLSGSVDEPVPKKPARDFLRQLAERNAVEMSEEIIDITPRRGVEYPDVWVGTGKEVVLSFKEPLEPGTLGLSGREAEDIMELVEFPVDSDRTKVKVRTMEKEGNVQLLAKIGKAHIVRTVHVLEGVGARAEPPLALKADARRDRIVISFAPNPKNKEHVVVTGYEVHRKPARKVGADFTLLWEVSVNQGELTDRGRELVRTGAATIKTPGAVAAPGGPIRTGPSGPSLGGQIFEGPKGGRGSPGPTGPPGRPEARKAKEEEVGYSWPDNQVRSDEVYLYKVRTVAQLSYPGYSEFTKAIRVETQPDIDFQYVSGRPRPGLDMRLTFEVARDTPYGIRKETFYNRIGEMIGGTKKNNQTGEVENFLTGAYLVDVHWVKPERGYVYGRIIYVDRQGKLQTRWRKEVAASYLWERAEGSRPVSRSTRPDRPGVRY